MFIFLPLTTRVVMWLAALVILVVLAFDHPDALTSWYHGYLSLVLILFALCTLSLALCFIGWFLLIVALIVRQLYRLLCR